MLTLHRIMLLFLLLSVASVSVAQDLDDLFDNSDETLPCECDHQIFSLQDFPGWMPQAARSALTEAIAMDPHGTDRNLLYCPTTNAVIERIHFKASCSFLVCPSDWSGFKPRFAAKESLTERGIPVDKIREMLQLPNVVMGPLEVFVRARHSRDMMGHVEANPKPQGTDRGEPGR